MLISPAVTPSILQLLCSIKSDLVFSQMFAHPTHFLRVQSLIESSRVDEGATDANKTLQDWRTKRQQTCMLTKS